MERVHRLCAALLCGVAPCWSISKKSLIVNCWAAGEGFLSKFGIWPFYHPWSKDVGCGPTQWKAFRAEEFPLSSTGCYCSTGLHTQYIRSFTMGVLSFSLMGGKKPSLILYPIATSVFYEQIYFSCSLFIYGVCIGGCVTVKINGVLIFRYAHMWTWACQPQPYEQ